MIVVVMGVAGSGKTTVGQQLAANLGWRFVEGMTFTLRPMWPRWRGDSP
jgi:gluconokinase